MINNINNKQNISSGTSPIFPAKLSADSLQLLCFLFLLKRRWSGWVGMHGVRGGLTGVQGGSVSAAAVFLSALWSVPFLIKWYRSGSLFIFSFNVATNCLLYSLSSSGLTYTDLNRLISRSPLQGLRIIAAAFLVSNEILTCFRFDGSKYQSCNILSLLVCYYCIL